MQHRDRPPVRQCCGRLQRVDAVGRLRDCNPRPPIALPPEHLQTRACFRSTNRQQCARNPVKESTHSLHNDAKLTSRFSGSSENCMTITIQSYPEVVFTYL